MILWIADYVTVHLSSLSFPKQSLFFFAGQGIDIHLAWASSSSYASSSFPDSPSRSKRRTGSAMISSPRRESRVGTLVISSSTSIEALPLSISSSPTSSVPAEHTHTSRVSSPSSCTSSSSLSQRSRSTNLRAYFVLSVTVRWWLRIVGLTLYPHSWSLDCWLMIHVLCLNTSKINIIAGYWL